MSYRYLLDIALILLSTKLLSLLTRKFKLPQVVGSLLAGVVMGPAILNILHATDFINQMAELGVIVLMFTAGLESNFDDLKRSGINSFFIALFGVIVPLIGGALVAYFYNDYKLIDVNLNLQNIFIGVVLTATSVSITVETLKELGKLSTKAGNAILGAAIIDDILGILVLTIITSLNDSTVNLSMCVFKIIAFLIFSLLCGKIVHKLFYKWTLKYNIDKRRFVIVAFVLCLLMSFSAEEFFGIADITGSFIAGLILSDNRESTYILSRFEIVSYMILSPMFFSSIGIGLNVFKMDFDLIMLTIILTTVAIITKIIGCGLGAKLCNYTRKETIQIGTGMISRGEVALIVASKGLELGLMSVYFLGPIIIMVIFTTIITPVLLKIVFN